MEKTRIGIVGCGIISTAYMEIAPTFDNLEIVACADLKEQRARAQAEMFGISRVCSVEELLADPEVDIVVNLTIPAAHAEVAVAALDAGKHVHNEKPLGVTREDGKRQVETAKAKGLRLGCAPDTFLGGGHQTSRKVIDDGWIGTPVAGTAFMLCHGHEHWHANPDFFYKPGGGPVFDMGPYYLTALVNLLGPVRRVTGSTRVSFGERLITSEQRYGEKIAVEVPTHVAAVLDFASGAVVTLVTSFDVWSHGVPHIEIYGSEGSLSVPNPNGFGGPVRIRRAGAEEWSEMPLSHGYNENSRSIGVADMASAVASGRPHRVNGELAYHVLDVMHAIHEASERGQHVELESSCARPAALPVGLREGTVER